MYSVPSMHSSVSMLVDENWYAMLRAASLDIAHAVLDLGHINIVVDVRMIRGKCPGIASA